ncbi:hypothetical protein GCM10010302_06860 [Streptomyces polychromogenes]|uniref:ArsR family transcriptional regulator n=1 Tax=Streptomyces polychromogenes TaxID=67342 RepID=A0ABP3EQ82_9ACTN
MILKDPEKRLRDGAETCRITERAAPVIVTDLESAGYLTRVRSCRRTLYEVRPGTLFRHPAEGGREVADLLHLLAGLTLRAATAGQPSPDDGDPRQRGPSG